jgi:hypothetical protein
MDDLDIYNKIQAIAEKFGASVDYYEPDEGLQYSHNTYATELGVIEEQLNYRRNRAKILQVHLHHNSDNSLMVYFNMQDDNGNCLD